MDNTQPRTDAAGATVNAHQGSITFDPSTSRYLWVGSAFVPCAHEPYYDGCANMSYGACGFNNNGIAVYSSETLANSGWRLETANALPFNTRAVGEYWEPNMLWNPATRRWVMWYIFSKANGALSSFLRPS